MFDSYIAQKKTKRAQKKRNKTIMRYIEQQIRESCKRGEYPVVLNKNFKISTYDYFCFEYRLNELDDEYIEILLKKRLYIFIGRLRKKN